MGDVGGGILFCSTEYLNISDWVGIVMNFIVLVTLVVAGLYVCGSGFWMVVCFGFGSWDRGCLGIEMEF